MPDDNAKFDKEALSLIESLKGRRKPAKRLLLVIALIGLLRHAADLQPAGMAGAHDAIAKRQLLDRQRLQQWIPGRDVRSSAIHLALLADPQSRRTLTI